MGQFSGVGPARQYKGFELLMHDTVKMMGKNVHHRVIGRKMMGRVHPLGLGLVPVTFTDPRHIRQNLFRVSCDGIADVYGQPGSALFQRQHRAHTGHFTRVRVLTANAQGLAIAVCIYHVRQGQHRVVLGRQRAAL